MIQDRNVSIAAFLDAVAARQPTPGGGSVTALVGALAAAIGRMTVSYSIGKKGLEAHQDELLRAAEELNRARELMLELMVEDQSAYEALTSARKAPADDPGRTDRVAVALRASIAAPETIAVTAVALLDLCDRLVDRVNVHLLSDLAVCADLAMATVRCGICNVRVNLADMTDAEERGRLETAIAGIQERAIDRIRKLSPRIQNRQSHG